MVAGGGSLAVDAHEGFAAGLGGESTALHPWAADYRFNRLRRLLAGRLRVRGLRDAVSLTRRVSNSFTSRFPTLRKALAGISEMDPSSRLSRVSERSRCIPSPHPVTGLRESQ